VKRLLITTGVIFPDIGGPASYVRSLATHLSSRGVEVAVVAYSSVAHHGDDKKLPFQIYRVWTKIPWGFRHALFFFRVLMLARRAQALYSLNAVSAGVPAAWVAWLTGRPLVVKIVGDYAWEIAVQTGRSFLMINEFQKSQKSWRIRRLDRLQRWVCRRAMRIIVPSEYLADLVSGWGVTQDRICVIYNGVSLKPVSASREEARRHIGVSGNIIMSAGRLVPWKGFRMLIKLMPQLLQVNQFFRLVIVGDGPDMQMLQSVVRNLGLERKVYLVGRQKPEELAWYLAAADMFVLNTGYEGFSHQVLEAMSAGVPVITTSVGGNREIVVQGQNGFLVRYNDEFNLVEAIKTLWRQTELREHVIANGHTTVAAFSSERMLERTEKLLTQSIQ
jgi:glycosyltransferase involved in cell wall biosynthesis